VSPCEQKQVPVEEETVQSVDETETDETPAMSEHQYRYNVKMTCGGCSGAITRVLERAKTAGDGVSEYTVSLETQEVLVTGSIPFDELTEKIAKTGKQIINKEIVV